MFLCHAGEVSLYVNNTTDKPPIGSGLNCQCKVTLEGVYKKSKAGQQQQQDAAAVAAFRKRLARYCSEMGARFIGYKPEGGVWAFEVSSSSLFVGNCLGYIAVFVADNFSITAWYKIISNDKHNILVVEVYWV